MDWTTFVIRLLTDFRQHDTFHTLYIFDLPGGTADPTPRVHRAISAHRPFDHYALSDTRSVVQSGTRGEFQNVVFSLGEAQFPAAAEAIVGDLVGWALAEIMSHGSLAAEQSLNNHLFLAQTNAANYFGVTGEVLVTGSGEEGDTTHIHMIDSHGDTYLAEVRQDGFYRMRRVRGGGATLPSGD